MFFRITPPKNSLNSALPASLYLNLDNIARVEEVRNRPGSDHPLTLKIFEKGSDRQHVVNDENTSPATMKAILAWLEKDCLNSKKDDGTWAESERKADAELSGQAKAKRVGQDKKEPEPAMAG